MTLEAGYPRGGGVGPLADPVEEVAPAEDHGVDVAFVDEGQHSVPLIV